MNKIFENYNDNDVNIDDEMDILDRVHMEYINKI
jgi:hypothetical protein